MDDLFIAENNIRRVCLKLNFKNYHDQAFINRMLHGVEELRVEVWVHKFHEVYLALDHGLGDVFGSKHRTQHLIGTKIEFVIRVSSQLGAKTTYRSEEIQDVVSNIAKLANRLHSFTKRYEVSCLLVLARPCKYNSTREQTHQKHLTRIMQSCRETLSGQMKLYTVSSYADRENGRYRGWVTRFVIHQHEPLEFENESGGWILHDTYHG